MVFLPGWKPNWLDERKLWAARGSDRREYTWRSRVLLMMGSRDIGL